MSQDPGEMDSSEPLFIVEVRDQREARLVGHEGCAYSSPPQPARQALALVRVLLGCPSELDPDASPWRAPVAGGRRTVWLHQAHADGQLHL